MDKSSKTTLVSHLDSNADPTLISMPQVAPRCEDVILCNLVGQQSFENSSFERSEVNTSPVIQNTRPSRVQNSIYGGDEVEKNSSIHMTTDHFYSKYYNEIKNYVISKVFPETVDANYKVLLKKRAKNYSVKEGNLFYGNKIVLQTKAEQLKMLEKSHIEEHSGVHLGVKKMSHIINSQCFWRGQYTDIANFVRQCRKCTEHEKVSPSKKNTELDVACDDLEMGCVNRTWKKVEVYLHGPNVNERGEPVFITAVVDCSTHFIVAKCLPEENYPQHMAKFLIEVFCTFGIVECFFTENCKVYLETVKEVLSLKTDIFQRMKVPFSNSLKNFIFCLQEGQGKCSWIQSYLDTYTSTYVPICETDFYVFVLKLNSKLNQLSPFIKMFNRKPFFTLEEDKENTNINSSCKNYNSARRSLRSSVLQCRHCQEVFTSKISFRIHQRTHTEEAQQRGMLEGQIKFHGERDRKMLLRPALKNKYLALRKRCCLSVDGNITLVEGRSSAVCSEILEKRRAELRASTVEAVRKLLVKAGDNRKRRGKYKKFPLEVQDQIAQYAIENGNLMAVRHFSGKLGVVISESTIRNIVKCYRCFAPEIRDEIGKFASKFGDEAAVAHFSEKLGHEVRFGLIRKFKNQYLSRFTKNKQTNKQPVRNEFMKSNVSEIASNLSDISVLSSDMRDRVGHYACNHTIQAAIDYFLKKYNLKLKEHVVRKCKKMFKDKEDTLKMKHLATSCEERLENHGQPHHQQPLIQQHPHHQPTMQMIPVPLDQQQHQHPLQNENFLLHPEHHQQQLTLMTNNLQHEQQSSLDHLHSSEKRPQLDEHQPNSSTQVHEPLSVAPCVTLVPVHHQPRSSYSLQEGPLQSSTQTIDILQSSLNLLNNPQINNPTTIIYNPSYQISPSPNLPSSQLMPISHQENSPHITFQSSNQCNSSNNHSSVPVPYQHQDIPISGSVIINQNVASVQTFPSNHVYPTFPQSPSVQPTSLAVTNNSLSLPPSGSQVSCMSHQRQPLPPSSLPTIALAIASVPETHFHTPSNHPAVVLSQTTPQPILISHSQTGTALLQHFIDSQPHLTPCAASASATQHVMNNGHGTCQDFSSIVEPQPPQLFAQKLNSPLVEVQFEASSNLINERGNSTFEMARNLNVVEGLNSKEKRKLNCLESSESNKDQASGLDEHLQTKSSEDMPKDSEAERGVVGACSPLEYSEADDESDRDGHPLGKSRKTKLSSTKGGRRKGDRGKMKPVEQKRGTYAIYSPEIRAEMGRYAAEHGSQKACMFFRNAHGYNVAESTMRGLRDKYIRKRMCSEEEGEVTSLGYAPRGRPMRLGAYDQLVQECIKELVKSGEKISSFLAIATARHVLMQYEPQLLEENGGKIKLNLTWAKSFLKRSGIKNYS